MFNYFKESLRRKKARRITMEYPPVISTYDLGENGLIEFANWDNPLVQPIEITQSQVDFFGKFINKGDLVIDIGANIGDTTVPMAVAAGKEGLTLAFDPNPYVFKILEANAALNADKTNIVPLSCAISQEEDEFYFASSEASFANGGISTTQETHHGKFVHPEKIRGVNLTSFLKNNYSEWLGRLSFIKIDTEGYDKEIIKSIGELIAEYKPILVAESFGASTNAAKEELYHVIDQHGYDIFQFEDFEKDTGIRKVNKSSEMMQWGKRTVNVYAVAR